MSVKKARIFSLIERLTSEDLAGFRSYLELPEVQALGIHKKLIEEIEGLVQKGDCVDGKKLIAKIWPEKKVSSNYLNRLQSELMGFLREYLAWRSWRNQPGAISLAVARFANEALWDEEMEHILRRSERELDNIDIEDVTLLQRQANLLHERVVFNFRVNRKPAPQPLLKIVDLLSQVHHIKQIKYAAALQNMERIFRKDFTKTDLDFPIENWEANYKILPLIGKMYFHAYHTTGTDVENAISHFRQLRILFSSHSQKLSKVEAWDLAIYLINFCARQIHQGKREFQLEVKSIFDQMLQAGNNSGSVGHDPWLYKNIIVTALKLGEVDWADQYIERHEKDLVNDFEGNAAYFCRAAVAFGNGNYGDARKLALKVLQKYQGYFYGIDGRILVWKCSFKLKDELFMASTLDAYIKFFQRSNILEKSTQSDTIRFFRFSLRYLSGESMPGQEQQKVWQRLSRDLAKVGSSEHLDWLRSQIANQN